MIKRLLNKRLLSDKVDKILFGVDNEHATIKDVLKAILFISLMIIFFNIYFSII